jgi:hypothetical protein
MLIAPWSTARSFAWPLGPRALAALVGGFYVVSAPVFVYAGRRSAIEVRGLAAAVLARTLPTLAATYLHRDVFDFDRLFAVAWVVLFVASPVTFALLLWSGREAQPPPGDARVHPAGRAVLAVVGAAFAGLAVWFWVRVSGPVPFEVAPLGARFLAAWLAFFAVLAAWPAVRPTRSEAWSWRRGLRRGLADRRRCPRAGACPRSARMRSTKRPHNVADGAPRCCMRPIQWSSGSRVNVIHNSPLGSRCTTWGSPVNDSPCLSRSRSYSASISVTVK